MVTALVLQLIQCVVVLPTNPEEQKDAYDEEELDEGEKKEVNKRSMLCFTFLKYKVRGLELSLAIGFSRTFKI